MFIKNHDYDSFISVGEIGLAESIPALNPVGNTLNDGTPQSSGNPRGLVSTGQVLPENLRPIPNAFEVEVEKSKKSTRFLINFLYIFHLVFHCF